MVYTSATMIYIQVLIFLRTISYLRPYCNILYYYGVLYIHVENYHVLEISMLCCTKKCFIHSVCQQFSSMFKVLNSDSRVVTFLCWVFLEPGPECHMNCL